MFLFSKCKTFITDGCCSGCVCSGSSSTTSSSGNNGGTTGIQLISFIKILLIKITVDKIYVNTNC